MTIHSGGGCDTGRCPLNFAPNRNFPGPESDSLTGYLP
jgi:hypothetical protein